MIRELNSYELLSPVGGVAAASCDCRRCREMSQLGDDIVDFFDGVWDGLTEAL